MDADVLVWEAATAAEKPIQWSPSLWTLHAELDPAIEQLEGAIAEIKQNLDADNVVMALSDYNDQWRKKVLATYKANRKDTRKPVIYQPLRDYLHESYETFQRPGLEGDDCLGVLLTNPALFPGEKIVVSIDKDMQSLPGQHIRLHKARESGAWFPHTVSKALADYFHMLQTVTGDATDGYPGCPGVGPVSGAKLLDPFMGDKFDVAGAWQAVVAAYAKKGLSEEVALQNARVARICRHGDYDYQEKKVKLWKPPVL